MKNYSDTGFFKYNFLHLKSCTSTQNQVKRVNSDFYLVQSDHQTEGRGRKGRSWESETGGLYYSLKFPQKLFGHPDPLLLLGSASLWIDVIEDKLTVNSDDLSIKWPNDLLLNGRKLGGFIGEKIGDYLFLGVGINVKNSLPDRDYNKQPVSLIEITDVDCTTTCLLFSWVSLFLEIVKSSSSHSYFSPDNLEKRLDSLGKKYDYQGKIGEAIGIDDDGGLKLALENDESKTIYSHDSVRVVAD